jgi:NitT/TauT family transport system permease protein
MAKFSKKRQIFGHVLPWILPSLLFVSWAVFSRTDRVPGYLVPKIGQVWETGVLYLVGSPGGGPYAGRFLGDVTSSLVRVGLGFGMATVIGLPLGILSGRLPMAERGLSVFINGIRMVPGIAWLPLPIVWFGIGTKTAVFLVTLAAFFPVYLNAFQGARQIDPLHVHAGAMLGTSGFRSILCIIVPGAMPHIVTGLRLGLGISWAYLVLGELTGVPDGLGAAIMDARMLGRVDMIVVGIIVIAFIGKCSDFLLVISLYGLSKSARRMT